MALLVLDANETEMALEMLKFARGEAVNSDGEPKAYGALRPLGVIAVRQLDELIARIEQHQKDVDNGDA